MGNASRCRTYGRVRLCGDYKVTVNLSLDVDQYPLPKAEDLFATLAGGKQFISKLVLTQAYLQLELDSESQKYCTISSTAISASLLEYCQHPHVPENHGHNFARD